MLQLALVVMPVAVARMFTIYRNNIEISGLKRSAMVRLIPPDGTRVFGGWRPSEGENSMIVGQTDRQVLA